jgi:ABC-2 type transport system ATP-binding protein
VAIGLSGGGAQNGVSEVLRDPRLVQKFDDSNNYIEVELAPNANAQALLRRLVDAGAPIERFELMQPSLHQIFLQRVGATGVETGMSGHG